MEGMKKRVEGWGWGDISLEKIIGLTKTRKEMLFQL